MERQLFKKYIFRLFIGLLAIVATGILAIYVLYSLLTYFIGFSFFFSTSYKWDAVFSAFMIMGMVLWPLFVACILIDIGSFIYFKKTKDKYNKEETKEVLRMIGKKIYLPVLMIVAIIILVAICGFLLNTTYQGAKIKYKLKLATNVYEIRSLDKEINFEVDLILKNDIPQYFAGDIYVDKNPVADVSSLEVMKHTYYVTEIPETELNKWMDISKADHYELYDSDRVSHLSFYYVNDICIVEKGGCYYLWRPVD